MRAVYELFLNIKKEYKETIEKLLYFSSIFFTFMLLSKSGTEMKKMDFFVYLVIGHLFHDLVVKFVIKI